jgi:hypothetical protein
MNGLVSGHDRGTLWVACRKGHKVSWASAPEGALSRLNRLVRLARGIHPRQFSYACRSKYIFVYGEDSRLRFVLSA